MADADQRRILAEKAATVVVDAAVKTHRQLGPGLLEIVYETCLVHELTRRGAKVLRQVQVPIKFDGQVLDAALRLDLLVEDCLVVEVKAVERMIPLFEAQALTYLRLTGHGLALILNFNVALMKHGIKRIIL
ncbi:MAG: GxxExxY protein [Phycisphaerae bacterium]